MPDVVYIALDKPFLRLAEAAELACVGRTKFLALTRDLNIPAIPWAGRTVYRRADIIAAMEDAAWRHCGDDATAAGTRSGFSTGPSPAPAAPADSVNGRLDRLQRSRKRKPGSRSRRSNSSSTGTVVDLPQSGDRSPRSGSGP